MGTVLTLEEMARQVADWRREGHRIVAANGHFDLLHVGHLRYLRDARAAGDVLIVLLNDDDSVTRLKGEGRPIVPANERAELLAGFDAVDAVAVFTGDSPREALAELRPEIHAKGTDYGSPENVPEFETVAAYGGRTVLVGDPKDHSTTDLLGRVRALPEPAHG